MSEYCDQPLYSQHRTHLTVDDISILIGYLSPLKETEILRFQLKPFSAEKLGYVGIHELLTIETQAQDDPKSSEVFTFFVKTSSRTLNNFQQRLFHEETKFYRDVMPLILKNYKSEPWGAKCILVKDNLMIMENLVLQGFSVSKKHLSDNQLMSAVATLARFHASSLLLENKLKMPLSEVYSGFFKEKMFLKDDIFNWKWMLTGMKVVESIARDLDLNPECIPIAYEIVLQKLKPVKGQRNVFCHSDLWLNNMMFSKDESSCRLVDFQMAVYRLYIFDLVQLLYTYNRDERLQKKLIQTYHSVLDKTLRLHNYRGNIVSLDEIIEDFEEKRICGLVMAAQMFPIIHLNKQLTEEFSKDNGTFQKYMYENRTDFVRMAMKLDFDYRLKVEDSVRELINFMQSY